MKRSTCGLLAALLACRGPAGTGAPGDHAAHAVENEAKHPVHQPAVPADPDHATMEAVSPGPVVVPPDVVARLQIRTEPASASASTASRRAPASTTWDAVRMVQVTAQPGGQVRSLDVPRTGEVVRRGAPLARLYDPAVRAAQAELQVARTLGPEWAGPAESRLRAMGILAPDLSTEDGTYAVRAPADGIVIERPAMSGTWLPAGGLIAVIAPDDAVVVEMIVTGSLPQPDAVVTLLEPDTGASWSARVGVVLPVGTAAGRAVRLVTPAPPPVGRPLVASWVDVITGGVWVPATAVVDTGERRVVFVATDPRTFIARTVSLGARTDGRVQVLAGLSAGEPVVVAGTFLLDSETQLRSSGHAGHGM